MPFLRITVPLCAGIVTALYFRPGGIVVASALGLGLALLLTGMLICKRERNHVSGVGLVLLLIAAGHLLYIKDSESLSTLVDTGSAIKVSLSEYPEKRKTNLRLLFRLDGIVTNDTILPLKGSILVYSGDEKVWRNALPGDEYLLNVNPLPVRNRGNPYEFDYAFYLRNRGIRYFCFADNSNVLASTRPSQRSLKQLALITRQRIIGMYAERGINNERLATVAALSLGEKSLLEEEQKKDYISAGVMHIMAVSGLHAVILSIFVMNLLFFLKGKYEIIRTLVAIVFLWAFAFVTGLTPSVVRATLMFSFLHGGRLMKRPVNPVNSLLASAFILIVAEPAVIFDAGFLLSYSAVLFIISFYRKLCELPGLESPVSQRIWQMAAVSLAAQAGTLPLTIMMFNRFPMYFLAANLIIVPLSSAVVIEACLIILTYPVRAVSELLAWLLSLSARLTDSITSFFASLPGSSVTGIGLTLAECIILTAALFVSFHYLLDRKHKSPFPMLFCLLLLAAAGTFISVRTRSTAELIVYNTGEAPEIAVRSGKCIDVWNRDAVLTPEVMRHSSVLRLRVRMHELPQGNNIIKAGETKVIVNSRGTINAAAMQGADYLVLTHGGIEGARKASNNFPLTTVILAAGLPSWSDPGPGVRDNKRIHFISFSGAFTAALADTVK